MSAAIVNMSATPEFSATVRAIVWAEDNLPPIQPPGQLWERVAEREPAYSWRCDFVTNGGERDGRDERGPLAEHAPAHLSGVIERGTRRPNNVRAGERIK